MDLRLGQALASRTYAELAAFTADIPGGLTAAMHPWRPLGCRHAACWRLDRLPPSSVG